MKVMIKKKLSTMRGFTLIELLVVMVIIGMLATLGVVNYLDARLRARDTQRKAAMQQIQSALEFYRNDQSAYPASLPTCGNAFRDPGNTITYMQRMPCDPTNSTPFFTYRYTLTGSNYTLAVCLENIRDAQKDQTNAAPCNGTSNWSYTLRNP